MRVIISKEVKDDILKLHEYISHDNPAAANKLVNKIFDCIDSLSRDYNSGCSLWIKRKVPYRFMIVKPYLVFYEICNDSIKVVRVLHGSMNYIKILGL